MTIWYIYVKILENHLVVNAFAYFFGLFLLAAPAFAGDIPLRVSSQVHLDGEQISSLGLEKGWNYKAYKTLEGEVWVFKEGQRIKVLDSLESRLVYKRVISAPKQLQTLDDWLDFIEPYSHWRTGFQISYHSAFEIAHKPNLTFGMDLSYLAKYKFAYLGLGARQHRHYSSLHLYQENTLERRLSPWAFRFVLGLPGIKYTLFENQHGLPDFFMAEPKVDDFFTNSFAEGQHLSNTLLDSKSTHNFAHMWEFKIGNVQLQTLRDQESFQSGLWWLKFIDLPLGKKSTWGTGIFYSGGESYAKVVPGIWFTPHFASFFSGYLNQNFFPETWHKTFLQTDLQWHFEVWFWDVEHFRIYTGLSFYINDLLGEYFK